MIYAMCSKNEKKSDSEDKINVKRIHTKHIQIPTNNSQTLSIILYNSAIICILKHKNLHNLCLKTQRSPVWSKLRLFLLTRQKESVNAVTVNIRGHNYATQFNTEWEFSNELVWEQPCTKSCEQKYPVLSILMKDSIKVINLSPNCFSGNHSVC